MPNERSLVHQVRSIDMQVTILVLALAKVTNFLARMRSVRRRERLAP